ncbi:MAG: hypothetical protein LH650_12930 [Chloroflexi bacterium]|nr:hypothetical protein [Chloroflexota bacterium]
MTSRAATFEWHTPPPTSVDEELVVMDDHTAVLVVRAPRQETATIGSYAGPVTPGDLAALTGAGAGPHVFDVLAGEPDAGATELRAAAERVAGILLATPRAVVTFHAHSPGPDGSGAVSFTLLAVAAGSVRVVFELDPAASSVQFFSADDQPMSWQDLPELPSGFFTADAAGLGGVRRPATITPGAYGAIAFVAAPPPGAAQVAILVAGTLSDALPDVTTPDRFEVRTALAAIPA